MKAVPYIQNKRDDYKLKLSYPKNNYCTGAHSQYKRKEKNNCENDFSPPPPPPPPHPSSPKERTPSQILMKYFVHFKNICFNKTSATDQFKTKIGNYNTSFLSSFSLLKYLFVLPLNFIARKEFMSQKGVYN